MACYYSWNGFFEFAWTYWKCRDKNVVYFVHSFVFTLIPVLCKRKLHNGHLNAFCRMLVSMDLTAKHTWRLCSSGCRVGVCWNKSVTILDLPRNFCSLHIQTNLRWTSRTTPQNQSKRLRNLLGRFGRIKDEHFKVFLCLFSKSVHG